MLTNLLDRKLEERLGSLTFAARDIAMLCHLKDDDVLDVALTLSGATELDSDWGRLVHVNNGANILAVAHVDTVGGVIKSSSYNQDSVTSIGLDDRLGVYTMFAALPTLGIRVDVLLTTDEESMASTGRFFSQERLDQYNWAFSFDRAGTDVVLYQNDTPRVRKAFKRLGIPVGHGSISDLSDMFVFGVNFGVGYEYPHSHGCNVRVEDWMSCIRQFLVFWERYHGTNLKHWAGMPWRIENRVERVDSGKARHWARSLGRMGRCEICSNDDDVRSAHMWSDDRTEMYSVELCDRCWFAYAVRCDICEEVFERFHKESFYHEGLYLCKRCSKAFIRYSEESEVMRNG